MSSDYYLCYKPMRYYIQRLEEAASHLKNEDIPNSTMSHAEAGIRVLFENAQTKVRILSTEFYAPFWNNLKYEMDGFLGKGGIIEILTIDDLSKESTHLINSFKRVSNHFSYNRINKKTSRQLPNLIIADDTITRFEKEDSHMKAGLVSAIINFNNTERATRFNEFFEAFVPESVA